MKKQALVVLATAVALALPVAGCSGNDATTGTTSNATSTSGTDDFDAVEAYWGEWRGSVETSGTSVYGTTGGSEHMLDINLAEDGTCTVEPVEAHADLPSDSGTWDGTESEIVLHLSGGDVTLTVTSATKVEGNAADFGIADFETINFDFYG